MTSTGLRFWIGLLAVVTVIACAKPADLPAAAEHQPTVATPEPTQAPAPTATATRILAPSRVTPTGGETSLQERIAGADLVVRASIESVRQVIDSYRVQNANTGQYKPLKYSKGLEYTLTVHEYLKGSGSTELKALAVEGWYRYPTSAEAQASGPDTLSTRDTQWENREGIFFLREFPAEQTQRTGLYFLGYLHWPMGTPDMYTIASQYSKRWLPSATASSAGQTTERTYLLDVPVAGQTAPTITMTALKAEIAKIVAEIAQGDGTEAYAHCVYSKYRWTRKSDYDLAADMASDQPIEIERYDLGAGVAEGTRVNPRKINYESQTKGGLEGEDSALFEVDPVGVVKTLRPLPAGEYGFTYLERPPYLDPCDAPTPESEKRYRQYVVYVTAPSGVLYEAFFDPVAVGSTIRADGTNGVLKPTSFTDSNGASATLHSISYEAPSTGSGQAGTVKLKVSPHTGLSGQSVDIIELDGAASLSLDVADATVNATENTLSWSVSSQPWEDGDKLMVRIRKALPPAPAPASLTATASGEETVDLSWAAVTGASGYHVQNRESGEETWETVKARVTGTKYKALGLSCGTAHKFRVGAYGDGTKRSLVAGLWSPTASATTATCSPQPPRFESELYSFVVDVEAGVGDGVGSVSAIDVNGDTVTYSIASGNDAGKFGIGASTGEITIAAALGSPAGTKYKLKVGASDGVSGTTSVEVTITVAVDYDTDDDGLLEIKSVVQLNAVRWDLDGDGSSTNAGYGTAYPGGLAGIGCPSSRCKGYELAADLDFDTDGSGAADSGDAYWNTGSGWVPIGTKDAPFNAVFDGSGHAISNLYVDRDTTDHVGLFGGTGAKAALKRVVLRNALVTGKDHVGALVGIGANAASTIADSYGIGVVSGNNSVGGLVGSTHGKVAASHFTGAVDGRGNVGGLVGEMLSSGASITNSYADAVIDSTYENTGGLVGRSLGGTISSSYASGDVNAPGGWNSGGLVGRNAAAVTNSYALGYVKARGVSGGLIGRNSGTVTRTYADGNVISSGNKIGGLVARQDGGAIRESYSIGKVEGVGDEVGGLIGTWRGGSYLESIWDTETSGQTTSDTGWGRTSSQMRSPTSNTDAYRLWSGTAWDYGTSGQYPVLKADWNGDGTATWQEFGRQRVPREPTRVQAGRGARAGELSVSWSAPSWDGGSAITSYDVRHIPADDEGAIPSSWTVLERSWTSGGLKYVVTGLKAGVNYKIQVRGVNANGKGRWSDSASLSNRAPVFSESSPSRTVAENTESDAAIGEPVTATDAEGDDLTYSLSGADAASFEIDEATGQIKTSAPLNYEKRSSYAVKVEVDDGSGAVSVAVSITVTDVEEAPVVVDDAVTTDESTAVIVSVLKNDADEDADDTVVVASVTQPANGSSVLDSEGVVTYTPNAGFHGEDSFTYTASDGVHSVAGSVSVTVKAVCSNGTAVPSPADHSGLVRDCTTLLAVKDTLRGTVTLNWSENIAVSTWTGVTLTDSSDGVQFLRLSRLRLDGSIPSKLGDLTKLKRLNLEQNRLTGSIPGELGDLANLTRLNLGRNRLSGSIPGDLGDLSNLKTLRLSSNRLTGAIPAKLGGLASLTELSLNGNRLDGAIPSQLGSLTKLIEMRLNDNGLTGAIPSQLGSLTRLTRLYLDDNDLSGCIPTELGSLTNLVGLRLAGNSLTGSIPAAIRDFDLEDPTTAELQRALNLPWSDAPGAPVCGQPTIAGALAIASTPTSGGAYAAGEDITVSVTFSEAVTVGGTPQLGLQVGSAERQADYASGSTTKTLKFTYTVVAGEVDENGVSIGENKLALNGGTIRDGDGDNANLSHPALADQGGHKVDATVAVTLHLSETAIAEAGGIATVTATLDRAAGAAVTVTVTAAAGSGASASDYTLSENAKLVIAANSTTSTGVVTVTAVDNDVDAADKTVTVSGTVDATGVTAPDDVALTITDDEPTPSVTLRLSKTSIAEDGGTSEVSATMDYASSEATTITLAVSSDFTLDATTLTIPAGQTTSSGTVTLTAVDNDADAPDKTVSVSATASNPHAVNQPDPVTLKITDDDPPEA